MDVYVCGKGVKKIKIAIAKIIVIGCKISGSMTYLKSQRRVYFEKN
jgi:hypothetical protein